MSTIERAMRKLRGDREAPRADAEAEAGAVPPEAASASAAAADGVPADIAGESGLANGVVEPVPTGPGPATATPQPVGLAGTPAGGGVVAPEEIPPATGPIARVDFERLRARGFLVPGEVPDRKAEEYQHIKRRIIGNMVPGVMESRAPSNLIMITSSLPGEGKTFTSLNLAVSIAMEMDRTVLLIDTDIIKADVTRLFGAQGHLGLFDVLTREDLDVGAALIHTNVPKLVLLPAGTSMDKVTEKLASDAMHRLAVELANRYHDRIIIFDCPPVLATTGAVALSQHVGQVILVVEAGKTTQETLKHALETIEHVNITGLILNKSKQPPVTSKYYGYGYYHSKK